MKLNLGAFSDSDDSDSNVDADSSLIAAYLAREATMDQLNTLEERLSGDDVFRKKMQLALRGFAAPLPQDSELSSPNIALRGTSSLSRAEIDAAWRDHLAASHTSTLATNVGRA